MQATRSGREGPKITIHLDETIRVLANVVFVAWVKNLKIVCIVRFCLIYISVFGAEAIMSDERSNRYFRHILVTLFCHDNVGTSI